MQALIITGGHISFEFALKHLKHNTYDTLIACDSGLSFFKTSGIIPNIVIGDFDSADKKDLNWIKEKAKDQNNNIEIIELDSVKDDTDTGHGINLAIELGAKEIHLLGATGFRIDHLYANIDLLALAYKKSCKVIIYDKFNKIYLTDKNIEIENNRQYGNFISFFPYTNSVTNLTLMGFKYPLINHNLEKYYNFKASEISCVSNEIIDDYGQISFNDGILLVMETKEN